jgi:hypothetical protein
MDVVSLACVTGFAGDALLQTGVKLNMGGPTGWGLKDYFKQHGAVEALFIPGGMLTIFFVIYIYVLQLPLTYTNVAVYGIIIDLIFRKTRLFPSLDKYYEYFDYLGSAVWIAIPMMIPLFLLKMTTPEVA